MGFYNIMETSFFLSLGITFVLILLLVYHFKQRLSATEAKQDTMFEIINNIAQEISNIKSGVLMQQVRPNAPHPCSQQQQQVCEIPIFNNMTEDINMSLTGNSDIESFNKNKSGYNTESESENKCNSDSDSDSESDSDSDSDSEESIHKIVVSDDEHENETLSYEDIFSHNHFKELNNNIEENIKGGTEDIKLEGENENEKMEDEDKNEKTKDEKVNVEEIKLEVANVNEKSPDFSKMNLGTLRTYVSEKGWVNEANKMKKTQLLSVISEHA